MLRVFRAALVLWLLLLLGGCAVAADLQASDVGCEERVAQLEMQVGQLQDELNTTSAPSDASPPVESGDCPSVESVLLGVEVGRLRAAAGALRTRAEATSAAWEAREISYRDTHVAFEEIAAEVAGLQAEGEALLAAATAPASLDGVVVALGAMVVAAQGLVSGLEAPDDGTQRRAALEALVAAAQQHEDAAAGFLVFVGASAQDPLYTAISGSTSTTTSTSTSTTTTTVPPTTTTTRPATTTTRPVTTTTSGNCHPSYPTVCIPPPPPDLDCPQIPYRNFAVTGSDPHRFDGDNDGVGCET